MGFLPEILPDKFRAFGCGDRIYNSEGLDVLYEKVGSQELEDTFGLDEDTAFNIFFSKKEFKGSPQKQRLAVIDALRAVLRDNGYEVPTKRELKL